MRKHEIIQLINNTLESRTSLIIPYFKSKLLFDKLRFLTSNELDVLHAIILTLKKRMNTQISIHDILKRYRMIRISKKKNIFFQNSNICESLLKLHKKKIIMLYKLEENEINVDTYSVSFDEFEEVLRALKKDRELKYYPTYAY